MTNEQMNDFLESIDGLTHVGYRDNRIITDTKYFSCHSGWNIIIKELIEDLIKMGWNKQVVQVKEKFAGLRFYIQDGSEEMYNRISLAEKQSYETCETCGEQGKLRSDIGWWLTLCDEHYNNKKR